MGDSTFLPPNVGNKGTLHSQGTVNMHHTRIDHKKYVYLLLNFIIDYLFMLILILRSMRHSIRRGSMKLKQTYEHLMENGDIGGMNRLATATRARPHDLDIKLLQAKRQQAEMRRNQREEDLRENHPLFDTPLFIVPRESKFRKLCQLIVYARYDLKLRDPITGEERQVKYKGFQ